MPAACRDEVLDILSEEGCYCARQKRQILSHVGSEIEHEILEAGSDQPQHQSIVQTERRRAGTVLSRFSTQPGIGTTQATSAAPLRCSQVIVPC